MAKTLCVHFSLSFLCAISRPVGRRGGKFGCWRLAVAFGCCVWPLAFGIRPLIFGLLPLAHALCLCFCLYLCFCLCLRSLLFSLWLYVFGFFCLSSSYFCYLLSSSFLILPFLSSSFGFIRLSFFIRLSIFFFVRPFHSFFFLISIIPT